MATTADPQKTYIFNWFRLIYTEAFRRLGLQLELTTYPTQRIGVLLEQGGIDGEVGRARVYGEAYPQLIRVDESVLDVDFALFAANPELKVAQLADLRGSSLVVGYRRGVVYCEQELGSVLPAAQIADVTQEEQGLRMLVAGRIDLFCGMDTAVWSAMELPTLRNNGPVRKAVSLQLSALYPYLHPKQAARAAPLAAALKAMKAEGLVERYRLQALREYGR